MLYSNIPGGNENKIDAFLNSLDLSMLDEEQNRKMTANITEGKFENAIRRLKLDKSPGADGYIAVQYKNLYLLYSPH